MLWLKAMEYNWGLRSIFDWNEHSWEIDTDGRWSYNGHYKGTLSREEMEKLKQLIDAEWTDEEVCAFDGTAWEFELYDNGTVIRHRKMGYIYGIEPYKSLAEMLSEKAKEVGGGPLSRFRTE